MFRKVSRYHISPDSWCCKDSSWLFTNWLHTLSKGRVTRAFTFMWAESRKPRAGKGIMRTVLWRLQKECKKQCLPGGDIVLSIIYQSINHLLIYHISTNLSSILSIYPLSSIILYLKYTYSVNYSEIQRNANIPAPNKKVNILKLSYKISLKVFWNLTKREKEKKI